MALCLERIMPPTVKVKSNDAVTKLEQEATAQEVLAHFGNQLPDLGLLCFMDNDAEARRVPDQRRLTIPLQQPWFN